ncbi:MAG: hypothetical protein ACYCS7_10035 [Acidimicrobiales bacterium]
MFHEPNQVERNGECPGCGRVIAPPRKVPWHFKLVIVATTIYLAYRAFQGFEWLAHHL